MAHAVPEYRPLRPALGQRVRLMPPHPWAGAVGTVVAWETLIALPAAGPRPRVRLDSGQECFLVCLADWRPLETP